jgi:hypothetical protein
LQMDGVFFEHSPGVVFGDAPKTSAKNFAVHVAFPEGGSLSSMAKICFSIVSSYRRPAPGRGAS